MFPNLVENIKNISRTYQQTKVEERQIDRKMDNRFQKPKQDRKKQIDR